MHRLQREIDENKEVRDVVLGLSRRVAENNGKMGILLDLNPIWRLAARLAAAGLEPDHRWYGWVLLDPVMLPFGFVGPGSGGALDLSYRSSFVQELTDLMDGRNRNRSYQPFLLRLLAYTNATQEEREALIDAARATPILTVVNTHPVVRHVHGPGSLIAAAATGRSGTLGGYLTDSGANTHFAVTCGHVAKSGNFMASRRSIGSVTAASAPTPLPDGAKCHVACGSVTELDIALVDVGSPGMNIADKVAGDVCNGDLVTMDGASSGSHTYEVGGFLVEHEISGACWKRLIQLHAPRHGLLPVSVSIAAATLPQDGDSGAWVHKGTEWAGMVVASDKSLFGYAMASDTLIETANRCFGMRLTLS